MKKRSIKFLIILIGLFSFVKTTFADGYLSKSTTNVEVYIKAQGVWTDSYKWSFYKIGNQVAYCRNPQLLPDDSRNPHKFICTKLSIKDGNVYRNSFNYGILTILNNGNIYDRASDDYVAVDIAIRTYESYWSFNQNPDTYPGDPKEDKNWQGYFGWQGYLWFSTYFYDKSDINSLLSQVKTDASQTLKSYYVNNRKTNYDKKKMEERMNNYTADGSNVVQTARDLIKKGLEAAKKYQNEGLASAKLSSPFVQSFDPVISDKTKTYSKSVIYTADLSAMNNVSNIPFKFECSDCSQKGVDYTLMINGQTVSNYNNINFKDYAGSNKKVQIVITFTSNSSYTNCKEVHYKLEFGGISGINENGYNCIASPSYQQFYTINRSDTSSSGVGSGGTKKEGSLRLCNPTCKELENSCNGGSGPAEDCEKFKNDYNNSCVVCTTNLTNPSCTQEDTSMYIKEGYEEKTNKCQVPTESNIKSCIINGVDKNGNSYQATDLVSDGNKYCSVWCKEDYKITLPGTKNVMSGTYFSLQAKVKGTKTCYTSNIDIDTFKSDLKLVQDDLLVAFNTYNSEKNNTNLNNLKEINDRLEKIISSFQSCSNWTMSYNFQPKIKFNYEEKYMNSQVNKILEPVGKITKSNVKTSRCEVETSDKEYTKCSTGWQDKGINEVVRIYSCRQISGTYSCSYGNVLISKVKNMKESIEALGSYATPTQFIALHASGSVVLKKNVDVENGTLLKNGLPVPLNKTRGIYDYTLKVENLGEYYNNYKWGISQGSLGRIWGANDNLVSEKLKEQASCSNNDECLKEQYLIGSGSGKEEINKGVYVCKYIVNIDQCIETSDDKCNPNCPDDPDCKTCIDPPDNYCNPECPGDPDCKKCIETSDDVCDPECPGDPDCDKCIETSDNYCNPECPGDPDCDKCIETSDNYCNPECPGDPDCNKCIETSDNYCNPECPGDPDCNKCIDKSDNYCNPECPDDPDCKKCIDKSDNYCNPDCPDDPDCDKCIETSDNVCDRSCPNDPDCPKPEPCSKSNNKFYCETGEECTEEQYNARCCPECGQSIKYKCMEVVENGKIVYYGKNYQKLPSEAAFKSECCEGGKCKSTCYYCLYDREKLNLTYRSITSEDINPNNRTPAVNWTYSTTYTNPMIALKAKKTVEEIKENGEKIYDVNFNSDKKTDFAMTIEMDSKMISAIRNYNKSSSGDDKIGNYADNTMSCYDYTKNGVTYENIFCYSNLLDTLLANDELKDKIKFSVPRPTKSQRNNSTYVDRYWTVWTEYNIVGNSVGGPSWK